MPLAVTRQLHHADHHLDDARQRNRSTASHLPLHQVRPNARLLDPETKLITHAVRMAAYNGETTLARLLDEHYSRAEDEARALIREAFNLTGDLDVRHGQLR